MIINGGSRRNSRFFAKHLSNAQDNERAKLCEIRNLAAETIPEVGPKDLERSRRGNLSMSAAARTKLLRLSVHAGQSGRKTSSTNSRKKSRNRLFESYTNPPRKAV
jgi:hypothetical protein